MQSGNRPDEDTTERQSGTQITICIPNSMAVKISRSVKARRAKEPHFSRNDFVRNVFNDYFRRHSTPDATSP